MKNLCSAFLLLLPFSVFSQRDTITDKGNRYANNGWSVHFQFTAVSQSHSAFKAKYSGTNSLSNGTERGLLTITSTAFIGRRLWRYAGVYANPEIAGGEGVSSARGIAGFTNGESFRVGSTQPKLYMARYYLKQHIALSHNHYDTIDDDANEVKRIVPSSRLTLVAGKFCLADFFDNNDYSHDPRIQFLNWSLMSSGAWDYPANTRGYTLGFVAEVRLPGIAVRGSMAQMPVFANGPWLNEKIGKINGAVIEVEKGFHINGREVKLSLLSFRNLANAPLYEQATTKLKQGDSSLVGIFSGTKYDSSYHTTKYGFSINGQLELTDDIGVFFRAGYNDGKSAIWAFTEIDQSIHAGIRVKGTKWKRIEDEIGIAGVINGISKPHQDYLKAGGYGFIIGDGKLTYGNEKIAEIYYSAQLFAHFFLSADYQFVSHPAYNRDRGPVSLFSLRGHIEF